MAGILVGLLVGALPGFQANMGVALLLPFTYGLPADTGLLLLVSIYAAAIYGGSITAILFSTPGTTASAATAIEGYALTKQGKPGTALRIATWCSAIGGVAGALSLLVISPPLSLISLRFGPGEYLMLAIFGLSAIATIASGSLLTKGLIAGALGFLLSTVGLDLDSGYPRFTFGLTDLDGGIPFVPAVIGLFAMSQVLVMIEESAKEIEKTTVTFDKRDWRFFLTLDELKQVWGSIPRSFTIGMLIGILPGAGADVSAWVSYNEAKRFSKNPEMFGKGAFDGIASAEVAKSCDTGGSLIPLLTLGIPGSSTAAILLGALMIHGLVPGRQLFTQYAQITYTVIVGFAVANFLMGFVGLLVSRYVARLTSLSTGVLAPLIVTLTVIGSYALGNNIYDVWIMLVFGLLGYFMKNHGFQPAAMVLGLVLGPMAENAYRQSLVLSRGALIPFFLSSPISVILIVLILLTLFSPMVLEYRKGRRKGAVSTVRQGT